MMAAVLHHHHHHPNCSSGIPREPDTPDLCRMAYPRAVWEYITACLLAYNEELGRADDRARFECRPDGEVRGRGEAPLPWQPAHPLAPARDLP